MINIKIDSRKVKKGDTFVALKGTTVDGHDYIDEAVKNGAVKVVCEHHVDTVVPEEIVEDTDKYLTEIISSNYADVANKLDLIAITGTSGKTTTAYLTYQMLNKLGTKTAYIGTIGFYIPNEDVIELPNTTPNILDLYELILTAKEKNCKCVVMEVSSHALFLERVKGLHFKTGVFTNLSQDHLDFHITMENYLQAKLLLLNYVDNMIINADDAVKDKWLEKKNDCIEVGYSSKDYKIISYEDELDGTQVEFEYNNKVYKTKINLKNKFNVYNYLMSFAVCKTFNFKEEDILNVTEDIYPPKGRCEMIKVKNGIAVVDYAHKPDALEKNISAFLEHKKGNIITVVGCGGDRDRTKRPIMGEIATRLSDFVVFTSDNPRTEDPLKIIDDIVAGVKKDNYIIEPDRKKAIVKALDMIEENTVVLILGKGHEDYQILGHEKVHLDDMEEVKKYIENHQ